MQNQNSDPAAPGGTKRKVEKIVEHDLARTIRITTGLLIIWYLLAYWTLPALWRHYEHHPALENAPKTTRTHEGIPGDALNVALIGNQPDIIHAMLAAGWDPADPVTFSTSARITTSALFGKAYPTAPVSDLYLFGRIQDLAFEQPVPGNTRQRNHVRFWKSDDHGANGNPLWLGAATYDRSVGVSHFTGKITHHVAPDIDAERDKLMADLKDKGQLERLYQVTGIGSNLFLRNGGGDPYYTDGELTVGVLKPPDTAPVTKTEEPSNPVIVQAKNGVWTAIKAVLRRIL